MHGKVERMHCTNTAWSTKSTGQLMEPEAPNLVDATSTKMYIDIHITGIMFNRRKRLVQNARPWVGHIRAHTVVSLKGLSLI